MNELQEFMMKHRLSLREVKVLSGRTGAFAEQVLRGQVTNQKKLADFMHQLRFAIGELNQPTGGNQ